MADCSAFIYMYWDASEANLEQADGASLKALELAPDLAEAHASRGLALTLRKRYEEAEREFEVAIALDPKLFEAHYFYARACYQQGKLEEAARRFEVASQVRPEDFQTPSLLAMAYAGLGRDAERLAAYHRSLEVIERHVDLNPDDARALYFGAQAWVALGERERALAWADRATAVDAEDPGVLYNVGCVYALLGEADRALPCLEQAVLNGFGHKEWLENDTDLVSLRPLPRFQALLAKM
jgi:tetratricopeptide (TPR) repeat protein